MLRKTCSLVLCMGLTWSASSSADTPAHRLPMALILQNAMDQGHPIEEALTSILQRSGELAAPVIQAAVRLEPSHAGPIVTTAARAGIYVNHVVTVAVSAAPQECASILRAAFATRTDAVQLAYTALQSGADPVTVVTEALKAAPERQPELLNMAQTYGVVADKLLLAIIQAGGDPTAHSAATAAGKPRRQPPDSQLTF